MGALGLFIDFFEVVAGARARDFFRFEKLAVAEDGGEGIIELVGYAGNQLADGGHFFALEELFLGAAEIFIGFASLLEEERFVDRGGDLIGDGGEEAQFRGGKFALGAGADDEGAHDAVFGPQDGDLDVFEMLGMLHFAQGLGGDEGRAGNDGGASLANLFDQGGGDFDGIHTAASEVGVIAEACGAAQRAGFFVEEIDRADIGGKELGDLQDGAAEDSVEAFGAAEQLGDGIQSEQFAVAAADFHFRLLAFGDVEEKALIGGDGAGIVAGDEAGFAGGADFAVAAAELEFEVVDLAELAEEALEALAFAGIHVESGGNVHAKELLAGVVAHHAAEGVVEVHEASVGSGNEDAFLNFFEEHPVFAFGLAALGEIFQDVNGAEAVAGGVVEIGIGGEEMAAERGIDGLGATGRAFAIRAARPRNRALLEEIAQDLLFERSRLDAEVPGERAVGAQDAAFGGMDEDEVGDGVERVEPLAARGGGDLKQGDILDGETKKIGDVGEEVELVTFEIAGRRRTDGQKADGGVFAGNANQDERGKIFGFEPALQFRIGGGTGIEGSFAIENLADERVVDREARGRIEKIRAEA